MIEWNRERLKELARKLGVTVRDVVASHTTNDPFYQVSEDASQYGEWFKALYEKAKAEAPHVTPHLRRLYYFAVSLPGFKRHNGKPYSNDEASWRYLERCSKIARYMGLIRYKDITDRRNPEAKIYAEYGEHSEFNPERYEDFTWGFQGQPTKLDFRVGYVNGDSAEDIAERLAKSLSNQIVETVSYDQQSLQPYHLEVWCEKSTMNEIIAPICERFHVNFVSGLGEESITRVDQLIDRVLEADKPVRIFYISDYDPYGVCMPESVSRKIQFHNETEHDNSLDIKLCDLVLTEEQVKRFNLPKDPTKVRRHPLATELDALEALYPGELAKILTDALTPYIDLNLQAKIDTAIAEFRGEIYDLVYDAVMQNEDELNEAIEKYNSHYEEVNETLRELHEKVVEIHKQTEPIGEEIVRLQNEYIDLSELKIDLPAPEVGEEPEREWLYDNNLDYLEQTRRLKSHSNR
jgi:hypothetical protein